jgi:hypothetical protein
MRVGPHRTRFIPASACRAARHGGLGTVVTVVEGTPHIEEGNIDKPDRMVFDLDPGAGGDEGPGLQGAPGENASPHKAVELTEIEERLRRQEAMPGRA